MCAAEEGKDFFLLTTELVFLPQEQEKIVAILIEDDSVFERDESFTLYVFFDQPLGGGAELTGAAAEGSTEVVVLNDDGELCMCVCMCVYGGHCLYVTIIYSMLPSTLTLTHTSCLSPPPLTLHPLHHSSFHQSHLTFPFNRHPSHLTALPHSSPLTPHWSHLTPHTTPHTPLSHLTAPHSSLTPHCSSSPSSLTPQCSPLTPHTSLLPPHPSHLTASPHPSLHCSCYC